MDQCDNQFILLQCHPGLQSFITPFDLRNGNSWQENMIWSIIRLLELNCTRIFDNFQGDWKTVAEPAFEEFVMETVLALYIFSVVVNQQNHLDHSFPLLDNTLNQFHVMKSVFQVLTLLKSEKAKVDKQFAREVLARVLDHHFASGSGSKPNSCQIGGLLCQ